MEIPTPGVEPLKNFAMSAEVPVGFRLGRWGETVTTIWEERSMSPVVPPSTVHPVEAGWAEIPWPEGANASALLRLSVTRTMLGAKGSTMTVASSRDSCKDCAEAAPDTSTTARLAASALFRRREGNPLQEKSN